jgi:hypothetical protein
MRIYEWNDDTISHFEFESCYMSRENIEGRVRSFIEANTQLEDGDDEDEMYESLISKIYK